MHRLLIDDLNTKMKKRKIVKKAVRKMKIVRKEAKRKVKREVKRMKIVKVKENRNLRKKKRKPLKRKLK